MRLKRFIGLILVILCAIQVQNSIGQEVPVRGYENSFNLNIAGGKIGTNHTKFYHSGGNKYSFITDFQPNLAAKLMGRKQNTQTTEVEISGNEIKVVESTIEYKKGVPLHAEFDFENGKVVFNGVQEVQLPSHEVQVWSSWAASMMLKDPRALIGQYITIVDGSKIETYKYVELSEETVTVDSKELTTTRIKMEDIEGKIRSFLFWVTPEYSNLPIKMQRRDTGMRVNIELVTHQWES